MIFDFLKHPIVSFALLYYFQFQTIDEFDYGHSLISFEVLKLFDYNLEIHVVLQLYQLDPFQC